MLINPYLHAAAAATDPYFADVSLLVHMGTSFVDASSHGQSVTVSGANPPPYLNTVNQQVGSSCSDFASVAGGSSAGANLLVSYTSTMDLSAGAYTVEIWDYQRSTAAYILFGTTYLNHLMLLSTNTDCVVTVENSTRGHATLPLNQWNHVALVMDASDNATVYVNGVQQFAPVAVARASWADAPTWFMGGSQFGAAKEGLCQEWRITKGIARYLANFSPPTAPFPNS